MAGAGGAYTDTLNRALRDLLSQSGYNPDATSFPGLYGPVFNVRAFGADVTGAVDSASAFQLALSAAVAAGGGLVYVPHGTYKLQSQLTIGSNITFKMDNGVVFTTTLTGAALPASFFKLSGSNIVLENGPVMSLGAVANGPTLVTFGTAGWGIEIATGASDITIIDPDLRYFGYCIKASGTWTNVRIVRGKYLGTRVDIHFAGFGVYGSALRLEYPEFLPGGNWTVPFSKAGSLHIAGDFYYFENATGMTDTVYDSHYVDGVTLLGPKVGNTDGRPVAIVNAQHVDIVAPDFRQLVGTFTSAGVCDDTLTLDLVRHFTVRGGQLFGGGENGIDVLSCQHGTITGFTMRQVNSIGVDFSVSDTFSAAQDQTLSKSRLAMFDIAVANCDIEAYIPVGVSFGGGGININDSNVYKAWAGSTNFATSGGVMPFVLMQGDSFLVNGQGTHSAAPGAVLTDATQNFIKRGVTAGMTLNNLTTGATTTVTAVTATTLTGVLSAGNWSTNDRYEVPALANPFLATRGVRIGGQPDFGPRARISSINTGTGEFTTTVPHGFTTGEAVEFEWGGDVHQVMLPALKTGTHNGANGSVTLTDSGADFIALGVVPGMRVRNITDGSSAIITAVTTTTITAALAFGATNVWATGASYRVLFSHVRPYYVINTGLSTFKLALSFANAFVPTPMAVPDAGGGTGQIMYVARTNLTRIWLDGLSVPFSAHLDTIAFSESLAQGQDLLFSAMTSITHSNLGQARGAAFWYCLDPFNDYYAGNQRGFKSFLPKWWRMNPYHYDGAANVGAVVAHQSRLETFFIKGTKIHDSTQVPTDGSVRVWES